jgi:hypothetical protein
MENTREGIIANALKGVLIERGKQQMCEFNLRVASHKFWD